MSKNPEKQLEEFLAPKPLWMQKYFRSGFNLGSLTAAEISDWCANFAEVCRLADEYKKILHQIPAQWNEYCVLDEKGWVELKRYAKSLGAVEAILGRPRKDALRDEALELKKANLSNAQVARRLNQIRGLRPGDEGYATGESVRKLLKRGAAAQASPRT